MPEAPVPHAHSLRTHLQVSLLTVSLLLWLAGGWWIYRESRIAADRLVDEALQESGALLLQLAQHEIAEHGVSLGALILSNEALPDARQFRYQIWTRESRSAFRSEGTPEAPLLSRQASGYGWTVLDGQRWRAFAIFSADRSLQLQIAQSADYARGILQRIALRLVGSLSLALLAAAALVWWILERSFAPLLATAAAVAGREAADVRDLQVDGTPTEVLPLVRAFNDLLRRLRQLLQQERRFTADAAHELRTPLAAVRANAEIIQRARGEAERNDAVQDLLLSVDRGSRVIDQLLWLARTDAAGEQALPFSEVDLRVLVEAQCAQQRGAAEARGASLGCQAQECRLPARADLLALLLRNLLDNAIRYAGQGAHITVRLRNAGDRAQLCVSDDGPGISPAERERVFERFYRVAGTGQTGAGLGLSIVRRIAELHRATVRLDSGPGGRGLSVLVDFPAATAAQGVPPNASS